MNNWNKGPNNCKSVPDPNQTYIMDKPMGPNHKSCSVFQELSIRVPFEFVQPIFLKFDPRATPI